MLVTRLTASEVWLGSLLTPVHMCQPYFVQDPLYVICCSGTALHDASAASRQRSTGRTAVLSVSRSKFAPEHIEHGWLSCERGRDVSARGSSRPGNLCKAEDSC